MTSLMQESRKKNSLIKKNITFTTFHKNDEVLARLLETYFFEIVQPLYGDQREPLRKIKEGMDRICEFCFYSGKMAGMVVYKNHLSDEFLEDGIAKGIEIKTVFLVDKNAKTAGTIFKCLVGRAFRYAVKIKGSCLFATVSAQRPEVLRLMLKLGFKVVQTLPGKYIEGINEYLIHHPSPAEMLDQIS